jgi:hypothetical protein
MERVGKILPSAPRGTLMKPTYMVGNVPTDEPRRIVPSPKGINDFSLPLPKGAYFTEQGVRQWTSCAYSGGPALNINEIKANYDPRQKLLDEQAEQRGDEFLGRYVEISNDARNLLQEKYAMKAGLKDLETYQSLIHSGLTDEEAGQVMRQKLIEKISAGAGQSRIDYHQKQKDVIADMAIRRGVRVGLPQSMATSVGVITPEFNYSASEIAGVKQLLKHNLQKLTKERQADSMVGQNFNMLPKAPPIIGPATAGWLNNIPMKDRTIGIIPANDNPVLFGRQNVDYKERGLPVLDSILGRVNEIPAMQSKSGSRAGRLELGEPSGGAGGTRRPIGRENLGSIGEAVISVGEARQQAERRAGYNPIGLRTLEDESKESRSEGLARVARGGGNSSSSLAPPPEYVIGESAPANSSSSSSSASERRRGVGQRAGPDLTRSKSSRSFDMNEFVFDLAGLDASAQARRIQLQATALGINVDSPEFQGRRGRDSKKILDEIERRFPFNE